MRLFSFSKSPQRIQGSIGYFGLEEWWLSTFSDEERRHIEATFQPLGDSGNSLTSGAISYTSQTAVGLLHSLAGWFTKEQDRVIARKMLDKAEDLAKNGARVLDLHFLYGQEVSIYYKDRDKPAYLDKAVRACRQQIALAPQAAEAFKAEYGDSQQPSHKGYEQLTIILEKQGKLQETIELSAQAQAQGWSGDWSGRIERCKRKLAKA